MAYNFLGSVATAIENGIKTVLDGSGVLRLIDNSGNQVGRITNNILTFKYSGFGGDIVTTPGKTTTVIGKYDVNGVGTKNIIDSGLSKSGENVGGINALSATPNPGWNDQQIWININEPWLRNAASRNDIIRAISNPLSGTNVFNNLTNVPSSVFNNPSSLANYLKNLSDPNILNNLSFYGQEIKWLSENGYVFNTNSFNFIK